ncbi:MAG: hypothetical protein LUH15_16025 [Tannerellaceae bacterium]|nr:hypothetical protein [Tannerellaceae bacterium]
MKSGIVTQKSLLSDSFRIDPSYHLSDSIRIKELFRKSPVSMTAIGEQCEEIFYGNIFTRIFVKDPNRGIPYLTASDMVKSNIDSGKYVSAKQAEKLQYLLIKKDLFWFLVPVL